MTQVNEQDIPEVSKITARVLHRYINKHNTVPVEAIADIIQAGLEGWVEGNQQRVEQDKTAVI